MIRASVLASPFIRYAVAATVNGVPINPTSDVVKFAFQPQGIDPTVWYVGSWETVAGPPASYVARIQVGPVGSVILTKGVYVVWIWIADAPEQIITAIGELDIT